MFNISIFASGGGSNAHEIIKYFEHHDQIKVCVIITNNPNAGVLKIAEKYNIPYRIITAKKLKDEAHMSKLLIEVDYIILAGFLSLIPSFIIEQFKDKIINIHPSLLPKYGGKGMYGMNVHQSVFDHEDTISGMTIHLVNEEYDKGRILLQKSCFITKADTPESIALKVLKLEHEYYSKTIENYILNK